MLRSVFAKGLRDHRRGLLWWVFGLGSLLVLQIAMFPSIRDQTSYGDIWDEMPEALKAAFGISEGMDLTTGPGYLQAELFGFVLPLCITLFAVSLGGSAVAGEEERGTLDLLLAHPVRRRKLVVSSALSMAVLSGALVAASFVVMAAASSIVDMDVSLARLAAACVGVAALSLLFGAVALLAGCWRGRRGMAYAAAGVAALAAFMVESLASVADVLRPLRPLSPFRWAMGDEPLRTGFDPWMALTVVVAVAVVAAAAEVFERRDIASA